MPNARLSSPLTIIEGIGPKKAQAFAKLGVVTLEDLFYFKPRRYEDRRFPKPLSDLEPGQNECAIAIISELSTNYDRTEAMISDEYGTARVTWYTYKIAKILRVGMRLALYGPIDNKYIVPQFLHPEFEILRSPKQKSGIVGRIFPVYPANSDLTQKAIRKFVDLALNNYARKCLKEFLPQKILSRFGMMSLCDAITQIHHPDDEDKFIRARNRLSFEEFFLLQTGIIMRRKSQAKQVHSQALKPGENFNAFINNLPFKPTNAQRIAIYEILDDIAKTYPMNRLLQGDVGSGKTLVAASAMMAAVDSGTQAAFMAPTEILAQQHYLKLRKSLASLTGKFDTEQRRELSAQEHNLGYMKNPEDLTGRLETERRWELSTQQENYYDYGKNLAGNSESEEQRELSTSEKFSGRFEHEERTGSRSLNIALLTGSLKAEERRKILSGISDGSIDIVVGTHAVFSDDVNFHNLALVIVDEQHRFGVLQRNKLITKGSAPHVLTMTATPIPRTLMLSVYGDLEVSILHELPSGRKKVETLALIPPEFWKIPEMIREQVKSGGQVYYVCPVIDEGERDLHAVTSTYEKLRKLMPELRISMLHGRLSVDEKSQIMQNFSDGKIDLLVSTVVIEVGVDVPNATMIIIQDAGQFGLAQLHQLRGRVGRGKAQSYCVLLENENITPEGRERISAMVSISDGFELAEQDLNQRGAGEICGTHQHGVTDFRIADLVRDEKILRLARDEAGKILADDENLMLEPELRWEIFRRLGKVLELAIKS